MTATRVTKNELTALNARLGAELAAARRTIGDLQLVRSQDEALIRDLKLAVLTQGSTPKGYMIPRAVVQAYFAAHPTARSAMPGVIRAFAAANGLI